MTGGYVRLHRKILYSALWSAGPAVRTLAIFCLLKANWRPQKWFDGKGEIVIPRGAFVTSLSKIVTGTGLTTRNVRTALKHLIVLQFLTKHTTSRYTIISICHYETYQTLDVSDDKPNDKRVTSGRQAGDKRVTTIEEIEEIEEGEEERDTHITREDIPSGYTEHHARILETAWFQLLGYQPSAERLQPADWKQAKVAEPRLGEDAEITIREHIERHAYKSVENLLRGIAENWYAPTSTGVPETVEEQAAREMEGTCG